MDARKTNLGSDRSSFIGRTRDLSALAMFFESGERLVTVLGPPGIGKTRLAVQHVLNHLPALSEEGGAWFCDLSAATDAEGICSAVGGALGVPMTSGKTTEDTVEQLGRAMAGRGELLLILDNFEQVAQHARATLGRWLDVAPDARFLVTSRETLGLPGGATYELSPLDLPGEGADAGDSEAVQLFIERARSARAGFTVTAEEIPAIVQVVRELDGLPLAIELAAARMSILSTQQLLSRLPRRFELLADARRGGESRQATLKSAIDWSWKLLGEREQRALAKCSVFRGGFSLEAAEAVLLDGQPEGWALDTLQSLRERSLVKSFEPQGYPGELRFSLLVSVREYAEQRLLETGKAEETLARHADHYLEVGSQWAGAVHGKLQLEAVKRLALEEDNLIAVLQRALATAPATLESATRALRSLLVLDVVLSTRGPYGQHLAWLEAALGLSPPSPVDPSLRARALLARAMVRRKRGQLAESKADCEEALALARQAGDREAEGRALAGIGVLLLLFGQIDAARERYEAALAIHRERGSKSDEALVLGNLGTLHRLRDERKLARQTYDRALELLRAEGDQLSECKILVNVATLLVEEEGHAEEALAHYRQALVVLNRLGDWYAQGVVIRHIGDLYLTAGKLDASEEHYQKAQEMMRQTGDRRLEALCLTGLGIIQLEKNRLNEAVEMCGRAREMLGEIGDLRQESYVMAMHAIGLALQGKVEEATAAFERAEARLRQLGTPVGLQEVASKRAFLDLSLARQAAARGDWAAAAEHRQAALRRITEAEAPRAPAEGAPTASFAAESARIRIALRILRNSEWPEVRSAGEATQDGGEALVVHSGGIWFRLPSAKPVSFARRRTLRMVFAHLIEQRQAAPGKPVPLTQLLAAGWPGEKVLPEAGANRVYVALATLRKMGLKDVLRSSVEGYFLDPAVPLQVSENPSPAEEGAGAEKSALS